jgi:hypothetical protein
VSNPLADAGFFVGVAQLVRGRLAAVAAVAIVPWLCHSLVLLVQLTAAWPLLEGNPSDNRDVAIAALVGWSVFGGIAVGARLGLGPRITRRFPNAAGLVRLRPRELAPFLAGFAALGALDVLIQGLATRAFGVEIGWLALCARIPILYAALSIPSLGNFGTREVAWAALFDDHAPRAALVAYSLWTNVIFLSMNALIGALFLPRAIALLRELRRAQRAGIAPEPPLLHDAADS